MSLNEINSEIIGKSSEKIVMLHGWGQNLESMRSMAELLSEKYEVHLLDLPGFGKSPAPASAWGIKDYTECVVNYLHSRNLSNVILVGHSFGGRISVSIGGQTRDLVRGIVLINSHGLRVSPPLNKLLRQKYIAALRFVLKKIDLIFGSKLYGNYFIPRYASRDYLAAGKLRETFVKIVNEDLSEYAEKISAPTLLLWGERDTEAPTAIGKRYRVLIKNSEYVEFPGRGHFLFEGVGSHLCVFHMKKFLSKISTARKVANG